MLQLGCSRLAANFKALVAAGGLPTRGWKCTSDVRTNLLPSFLHMHGGQGRAFGFDDKS